MENSRKPPVSRLVASKQASILNHIKLFLADVFLEQQLSNPLLLVAYSGGLDSTVLLHTFTQLQVQLSFEISVMHVHHGLSENADQWANFCTETCAGLNVPLAVTRVNIDKKSGLGIEATARSMRYQALNSVDADFICLAHHQDDQAETLLLQLARGAGVKGLAGMAQVDVERKLLRPLLGFSRAELEIYAKQNHMRWINDESNDNTQFDRNFVRHQVLPTLRERYPAIEQTLSRSAEHLAEASMLLDDLAQIDAVKVLDKTVQYQRVNLEALKMLSEARLANLIRWWLAQNQLSMPSAQQLQQILQQLLHAKSDASIKIKVSEKLNIRRYQDWAYLVGEPVVPAPINLLWRGEEVIRLPDHSRLIFIEKMGEGLAFKRDGGNIKLRIKNREGGERFKPELGRPSRTLKQILQANEIPPWQREQLPLVFMDETLVIIPNIGVDANLKAESHEMGLQITWSSD